MSALRRDLIKAVEKELRLYGVSSWTVDKSSGHHKYRFVFNGTELMYVTSGSPSDSRAIERAMSSLRRVLGVKREVKKNPDNRAKPHRKAVKAPAELPHITPGRDFWGALKSMVAIPHFAALGVGVMPIDAAAQHLADAILDVGLFA